MDNNTFKIIRDFIVMVVLNLGITKVFGISYVQAFDKGMLQGVIYLIIVAFFSAFVWDYLQDFKRNK